MVSTARRDNKRPTWIGESLWQDLQAQWASEDAKGKSKTASENRKSDRDGLGISKHVAGPISYAQISRNMETELGRPVGLGEVFIKTHTRKDGTFVDEKAKKIAENYDNNIQTRLNQLGTDTSLISDGTSKLSTMELDNIFLESTIRDDRGNLYGLGRLRELHGTGSDSWSSSSTIATLQDQLKAAQQKIEEQEAENRRRDEELARRDEELARRDEEFARRDASRKNDMDLIMGYLQKKDPEFATFFASRTSETSTSGDVHASNDLGS